MNIFLNYRVDPSRISSPLKAPSELRSQVYIPAPLNTEPMHPMLLGLPGFGSAAPLSPRRSITAALRSSTAATAAAAAAAAHRSAQKRRQRRRHTSSKPWYARTHRHRKH